MKIFSLINYEEEIVSLNANENLSDEAMSVFSINPGTIPRTELKISLTSYYSSNGLLRYTFYPSFEWIGGSTDINKDTFSFALHDDYWNIVHTGDFNIYYGDNILAKTIDRPSKTGFSARAYYLRGPLDIRLAYTGTGCIVARPAGASLHNRMIFAYSQDSLTEGLSISLGIFEIDLSGAGRVASEELSFKVYGLN